MILGISSLSFSGSLEAKIEAAAAAGFQGIEIFREDLVHYDGKPASLGRLARDAGIEILDLQSLRDFEAGPAADRDWNIRRAERFLDLAQDIGAPMLVVCANTRPDTADDMVRAIDDLAELVDKAAQRGLRIGYEALSTSRAIRTYPEAWDIVRRVDRANLGLIVGAVHTLALGENFARLDDIPADRVFLVHLADAPSMKMDLRLLGRHFRVFPGQGDLPLEDLYETLTRIGYRGPLSLEIFNDQVRAMPPGTVANDGIRSLHLLAESACRSSAPEVTEPQQEPAMPAIQDIGFVEIACGGEEAEQFKKLLGALGFIHTHSHATMNVHLFRQGGIDIVVNEESEGLAHSFRMLHGLSVFALSFGVNDLPAMIDRIQRNLGGRIERHGGPIGPRIPAIRGLGGSFVYLLDGSPAAPDYYGSDFRQLADDLHPAGRALLDIDHYSQAVVSQEFLSSLLFYRAMFGFEIREQLDLIDPHGTVRNRNLRSGNGRVCMSLNASISPTSTTQRLVTQIIGAGYQHFAFRCRDIFAFARDIDQDLILQIPDNYYDDLLLRFDIGAADVEKMRQYNILYDRDDDGAYFQLYTRDINGLFLEVVQRDGYRGFGAANAPVRMAVQTRDYEEVQALISAASLR